MPELDLRQLDALVGRHIFGLDVKFAPQGEDGGPVVYTGDRDWLQPGTPYYDAEDGRAWELPRYSSNIAAAWRVVERMAEMAKTATEANAPAEFRAARAFINWWKAERLWILPAPEAARRICLAALRAMGVEVPTER